MNADTLSPLDQLFALPLSNRLTIEASAGTGKTWTICALIVRLVIEKALLPENLLVVTFTRAATAEMRDKIYQRLTETWLALSASDVSDPFIQRLFMQLTQQDIALALAQKRLRYAIDHFDQISVSTIHAFCRTLLEDYAFSAGQPFLFSVEKNTQSTLETLAQDFWRKHLFSLSEPTPENDIFLKKLLDQPSALLPKTLVKLFAQHLYKPYLKVSPPQDDDWENSLRAYYRRFSEAAHCWQTQEAGIIKQLCSAFEGCVSKVSYSEKIVTRLLENARQTFSVSEAPINLSPDFERLTLSFAKEKLNKGKNLPSCDWLSVFQDFWDSHCAMSLSYQQKIQCMQFAFFEFAQAAILEVQAKQQTLSQDDLLMLTHQALRHHPHFLQQVQQHYSAIIIDESQDVDPIQAGIFDQLFVPHQSFFVTVGDPKQAIYSFRGGDVYTYLKATQAQAEFSHQHRLSVNYRSDASIVNAVNTLFSGKQAFVETHIYAVDSASAPTTHQWVVEGNPLTGLEAVIFPPNLHPEKKKETPQTKAEADQIACDHVASEIARLLSLGKAQKAFLQPKEPSESTPALALEGKHIAVLVRKNSEALMIQKALQKHKIASIIQSSQSIFQSEEAQAVFYLLSAIRQPNQKTMTLAFSSPFFGLSANDLYLQTQNGQRLADHIENFWSYHRAWHQQGIQAALSFCFADYQCYQNLICLPQAERHLTNTRHLIEWLQKLQQQHHQNPEALYQQMARLLADAARYADQEDMEIRLESEKNLVQIMTIHKSKGLQFDLVFCPFLWSGKERKETGLDPVCYHDEHFTPCLTFNAQEREKALAIQQKESLAEDIRIAYVALTRAKYYCQLVTGCVSGLLSSPLGWLIHRKNNPDKTQITHDEILSDWQMISDHTQGDIRIKRLSCTIDDRSMNPVHADEETHRLSKESIFLQNQNVSHETSFTGVTACPFTKTFQTRQAYDFSRLNAHLAFSFEEKQIPVTDAFIDPIFLIPEGRKTGNCVHEILENLPTSRLTDTDMLPYLKKYQIEATHLDAIRNMIIQTRQTPLDDSGITLDRIEAHHKISEMRFRFPVHHARTQHILDMAQKHKKNLRLEPETLSGYMNGIIDLVILINGKYYLLDYKTNHLGYSPEDYSPDKLSVVMDQQGYHLQYLIYLVALRRWLSLRLPGYSDKTHLGGVYYLFTRGMSPAYGRQNGIFFSPPDEELIQKLDDYFAQQEKETL